MAKDGKFLAIDFGAESGRALLGVIKDGKLELHEIHRFPNGAVRVLGHMHWDALRQFEEVKQGLHLALRETGGELDSIGVDTWGVDFGLLGEDGELLGNPFHYRDERTNGMPEEAFKIVPRAEVFERTGIQVMQLNSLYQLFAMARGSSTALKAASKLLFMPDLFNYWLTGESVSEFSIATTSQCCDPRQGDWARDMLDRLGIPSHIMPEIVQPGTVIGPLAETLVDELGAGAGLPVVAPACHDTGSAVAAVPASGDSWAYLSSGTWSLIGAEITKPLINAQAMEWNFTNEGGVAGTYRFLHNIMGLWLVQECRRIWLAQGDDVSYAELTRLAVESEGFVSIVDPNAPVFLAHGDMPARIREFCRDTGQIVPETKGRIVRCVLDSLALCYRDTLEKLDQLLGKRHETIHIVGGGAQNKLLSQLTADVSGRKVVAGPIEATAIGNVLVQAMGRGCVGSLDELRQIVRRSFALETYESHESPASEKAYQVYKQIAS